MRSNSHIFQTDTQRNPLMRKSRPQCNLGIRCMKLSVTVRARDPHLSSSSPSPPQRAHLSVAMPHYATSVSQLAQPVRHAPLGTGHRPISNPTRNPPQRAHLSAAMPHYATSVSQLAQPVRHAPLGTTLSVTPRANLRGEHTSQRPCHTMPQRAHLSAAMPHYATSVSSSLGPLGTPHWAQGTTLSATPLANRRSEHTSQRPCHTMPQRAHLAATTSRYPTI